DGIRDKLVTGVQTCALPICKKAKLVAQEQHSPPLLANYEGNLQLLPNGDHFLGWGQQPFFTEFSPGGETVFEGRFVDENSSYREIGRASCRERGGVAGGEAG